MVDFKLLRLKTVLSYPSLAITEVDPLQITPVI